MRVLPALARQHLPTFRHLRLRSTAMIQPVQPRAVPDRDQFWFGPWPIHADEVFAETQLSFAFVNLKPIVPGHVLVSPMRVVPRFADLTPAEVSDLWQLAQLVGQTLEPHYGANSLTLAVQDGPDAGQTVPHVHVHVLPRKPGDFKKNDEVYDELDKGEAEYTRLKEASQLDLDKERVARTREEMATEAAQLRQLFQSIESSNI
eukprot:GHRR01018849.1.p1 GENE.GHRR01018849.1~~GHRR01018849.1.p1  ORF type:complete len:204 (+),score=56.53 GHRR01018849.1:171-782(+)